MEAIEETPRSPPSRNANNQRNNRGNQNRATAQPVQIQRTAVVRRVAPPLPGISFEVALNTPDGDSTSGDSSSGSDTNRSEDAQPSTSETNRAAQSGNAAPIVSSSSPQPGTSSQSNNSPQPPPMRRQGTFTRDNENAIENAGSRENSSDIDRPVVGDESVSFNIPLDTSGDQTDEETVLTFRLSTSDSLTTMRPLNNYQIKGVPSRLIGSGRGNETGKFSSPRGVAVSPINDSIVVADSSNHR